MLLNINQYYVDQSIYQTSFGDRTITSAFTSHGIKILDSDFGIRIRNINNKVNSVFEIDRVKDTFIGRDGKTYEHYLKYKTVYNQIQINTKNRHCFGVRVIWDNGCQHDFFYEVYPKFNLKTKKENSVELVKEINANIHLHKSIKENLLFNLENYVSTSSF